jgi:hypothetical protein
VTGWFRENENRPRNAAKKDVCDGETDMSWYQYGACLFAGAFAANVVPHFVYGICGDRFPTPFAKPPGKGLSSPTVNVVWALFNMVAAYLLFRAGKVASGGDAAVVVFFLGIAALGIMMSAHFSSKDTE